MAERRASGSSGRTRRIPRGVLSPMSRRLPAHCWENMWATRSRPGGPRPKYRRSNSATPTPCLVLRPHAKQVGVRLGQQIEDRRLALLIEQLAPGDFEVEQDLAPLGALHEA